MKLMVIGATNGDGESTELQYATSRLMQALPIASVPWVTTTEDRWEALERFAVAQANDAGLTDDDALLLLSHPYLLPAPGSLAALSAALSIEVSAALAFDSGHPCPLLPPDYYTVRGIERYCAALDGRPLLPYAAQGYSPAMLLIRSGVLRRGDWRTAAVCVPSAYVHDFSAYHQGKREEIIPLVPTTAQSVLDVGGGEGGFLDTLKIVRGCETHLAEFSQTACTMAQGRVDGIWAGDFLQINFDRTFDCITFLDVLEHTEWPLRWLERAKHLLTADGCVVASIPNVGHWSVVADLLEGRWDYAAAGIHCITHLRFFTRVGIEQLIADAGFKIVTIQGVTAAPPAWLSFSSMADHLAVDRDALSTFAFLVVAVPVR